MLLNNFYAYLILTLAKTPPNLCSCRRLYMNFALLGKVVHIRLHFVKFKAIWNKTGLDNSYFLHQCVCSLK